MGIIIRTASLFNIIFLLNIHASAAASTVLPRKSAASSVIDDLNRPVLPLLTTSTTTTHPTYYFWNVQDYPNPQKDPHLCKRSSPSLLCDVEQLLTIEQASKLEHLMAQTSNVSRCYCKECPAGGQAHGIQVAIALVRHIFRPYNSPQSASQEFANHLRTNWKFGACDNTVLILLVADADEITLSVGAIAEAVFDDKFFRSLITAHRNEFENGRFYEGLVSIIGGMRHQIISSKAPANLDHDAMMTSGGSRRTGPGGNSGQPATPGSTTRTAVAVVGIIVGFLLVIFILTGTILLAKRRFEASQSGGTLTGDEDEERPKPEGYWSGSPKRSVNDDDDDDDHSERGTDQVDSAQSPPPPPLPTTPPPSTPSQSPSLANRKLSTPSGVVEYEPVSIEEDDHQRTEVDGTVEAAADAEVGQEELLEASSRISTPEVQRHSRL